MDAQQLLRPRHRPVLLPRSPCLSSSHNRWILPDGAVHDETVDALKQHLRTYLDEQRDALLHKVDGLPERELRLPRTPTGTNLLGIVKHCLNVEHAYFGPTFGRRLEPAPATYSAAADG